MTPRPSPRAEIQDDAEALMRDIARDSLQAARIGWRIAGRVGRLGLHWFEKTTGEALDAVERRGRGRNPP